MGFTFEKDLKKTFAVAIPVAFIAGILAWVLGSAITNFAANVWGQLILSIVVIVALVGLKKYAKIDNLSFYDVVIFFAAITLVGSIITMFVPAAAPFILSISNTITVSGLLFTFLWIAIGEAVLNKFA